VRGLYVHVPFCVSKCAYCDFYSLAKRLDLVPAYVDAVLTEARTHAGLSFETLYLGGGTPSLLGVANLERLIGGLKEILDLSGLVEATMEVNPESASEDLLSSAMDLGFGRVSVGVQSLSDHELRSVGRVHTASQAVEAVSRVVGMGFKDVSADVIVGLPGQTFGGASREGYPSDSKSQMPKIQNWGRGVESGTSEAFAPTSRQGCAEGRSPFAEGLGVSPNPPLSPQDWGPRGLEEGSARGSLSSLRRTLEGLIGLGVNHLSVYCLSLEHGTRLAMNPPDDMPSEDEQADLFEEAHSLLEGHGFTHYEISNFCLPGRECRHNLNYWRGGEYLGLGPAAASHLGGRRWKNRADLPAYLRDPSGIVDEVEELGLKEKAAEEAMLRLRLLVEGLAADEMVRRFGEDETQELFSRLNGIASQGLLTCDGSVYRLARSQVLMSNPIFSKVLG
jgi:oxygen-independent coproporphyrinogen-3 oxidase